MRPPRHYRMFDLIHELFNWNWWRSGCADNDNKAIRIHRG